MALTSVRGYYRNGQIELEEQPEAIHEAEVIVTFLTPVAADAQRPRHSASGFSSAWSRVSPSEAKVTRTGRNCMPSESSLVLVDSGA